MKQTIKLNESELHRFIKESVKKAINELDWKTYMNASQKAYDKAKNDDEEDRAWEFADASERAFNRDFGHVEKDDNLEYYGQKANQDVSGHNFTPRGQYGVGMGSWTPLNAVMHGGRNIGRGETDNSLVNPNSKMKPSKGTIDAYRRGEEEMEKFANGKYNYKKGEGWSENESIDRKIDRIVSESIRRILKEWPSDDPNTDYSHDIENNKRAREYDEFNSLEGDINRLKRSYDDKLDGFGKTFKGWYINDEGNDDYHYVDTYYPSTPEARAYYDYANRVGDRSSKRKEDMEADFRLMDVYRYSDAYTRRKDKEEMEHRAKFGGFGDPYFMGRMHSKGKSMVKPPSNQA